MPTARRVTTGQPCARQTLMRQRPRRPRPGAAYPTRVQCVDPERATVFAAFNRGLGEVQQAENRLVSYMNDGSDRANCALVRNALRHHFGWTEALRQRTPFFDLPCHVLDVFHQLLASPPTVQPWCQTTPPASERGADMLASAAGDPDVYTFFGPFFRGGEGLQTLTAIHEMMHKRFGMTDVAYRFEGHYGSSPGAMANNADSHAGLAHALGATHDVVGDNPCVNNVLPAGRTAGCR